MCAENVPGLNHTPKSWDCRKAIGRGATRASRSGIVRDRGLHGRENAGMSSESKVRIFAVESLRFPEEGSSSQGKSGAKPRTAVVGDAQLVDIPAPRTGDNDAVTQKDRQSGVMVDSVQAVRRQRSEVHAATQGCDGD